MQSRKVTTLVNGAGITCIVVGTDGMSVFWQDLLTALPAFGVFASVGVNALDNNN